MVASEICWGAAYLALARYGLRLRAIGVPPIRPVGSPMRLHRIRLAILFRLQRLPCGSRYSILYILRNFIKKFEYKKSTLKGCLARIRAISASFLRYYSAKVIDLMRSSLPFSTRLGMLLYI